MTSHKWMLLGIVCQALACSGANENANAPAQPTAGGSPPAATAGAAASGVGGAGTSTSGVSSPTAGAAGKSGTSAANGAATAGSAGAAMTMAAAGAGGAVTAGTGAGTAGAAGDGQMAAGAGASAGAGAATGCDRACLIDVLDRYLMAVVAHDPSQVPISASLKMTDNGVEAKPGDGIWQTATALEMDKILRYADPVTKNVGAQCVMDEGGSPAMYEVRLKYEAGEITEIESMTVREADAANGFFDPSHLKPEPVFLQMPDDQTRMTRDELQALQQDYLDYLEGKKSGNDVAFDEQCTRYENGVATASGLSSFQLQSWGFEVTRRILIIDEEAQITWGMFPFMQSDTALVVGEAFKMLGGKIMMIQAVMAYMPSKAWD